MKKSLILLVLLVCLDRSVQAAVALEIIFDGTPGNRRLRGGRELTALDAQRYGPLISACYKSPEARAYILGLADMIDTLLPQAHAALSASRGRGERGRHRHRVAADIAKIVPSLASTPTSTRSPSSESVRSEDDAGSRPRSPLRKVADAAGRVLSGAVDRLRSLSPGGKLSSAVDGFQTPVKDKRIQQLRDASPALGMGGAGTGSVGGSPSPSRSSSVARSRSFFGSPPETPSGAPDSEKEALRAKVTALEAWKASHEAGGGSKLSEERAKVKALTTQLGAMMEEVARAKAETAVLDERLRAMAALQADRDRKEAVLAKRIEELVAQLESAQKENIALTKRVASTQKATSDALERGGSGIQLARSSSGTNIGDEPVRRSRGWFGK